jgi:hypothetical protein
VRVLAVDVHQQVAEGAQLGTAGGAAVDEGARAALAHQHAADQAFVAVVQRLLASQSRASGGSGRGRSRR